MTGEDSAIKDSDKLSYGILALCTATCMAAARHMTVTNCHKNAAAMRHRTVTVVVGGYRLTTLPHLWWP